MFRVSNVICAAFASCLPVATFNHARTIFLHGVLWDYGYGNDIFLVSKIYWALLTVFDPLAAWLLYSKPRAGIRLTIAVIVSDVVHNTYYAAISHRWFTPFYLGQVGFLILVICLAPAAARPFMADCRARA